MLDKLKKLLTQANEKGIPVPQARDHGKPSVSLTLLILSSVFLMLGLVSNLHPIINGINFWEALAWHITSAVLYYNRGAKLSKSGFEISSSPLEIKTNNQE